MKCMAWRAGTVLAGGTMFACLGVLGACAQEGCPAEFPFAGAFIIALAVSLTVLALCSRVPSGKPSGEALLPGMLRRRSRVFLFLVVCYIPALLVTFPGSFAYDVPFQLKQFYTGAFSTHHPLLHTLLLGGCTAFGRMLGSINLGAALYTVVQMLAMAACLTGCVESIRRQGGNGAAGVAALIFGLYPLHMFMAVNATKDVLFSGCFAWFFCLLGERPSEGGTKSLEMAGLGAAALLLRSNALYALVAWLLLSALILGKRCRVFLLPAGGAVVLSFVLGTGLGALLHAAPTERVEMLSVPLQQLGRVRNVCPQRLDEGEIRVIDRLLPNESWKLYDPGISDPLKFEADEVYLAEHPDEVARVWLSVLHKCPAECLNAFLLTAYPFFFPYTSYRVPGYYLQMEISHSYYEWCDFEQIRSQSLAPRLLSALSWRFGARGAMQIPVLGWLFNMGLICWIMLYLVWRRFLRRDWKAFAWSLLPVCLWLTFLLGPVMAGRYIYPFVCCMPGLLFGCRQEKTNLEETI